MNAVLITPMGAKNIELHGEVLDAMQKEVSGWIEVVRPARLSSPYVMVVNEEGRMLGLPFNPIASRMYGGNIFGHALVLAEGIVDGEPDFVGLTDTQVEVMLMVCRMLRSRR